MRPTSMNLRTFATNRVTRAVLRMRTRMNLPTRNALANLRVKVGPLADRKETKHRISGHVVGDDVVAVAGVVAAEKAIRIEAMKPAVRESRGRVVLARLNAMIAMIDF